MAYLTSYLFFVSERRECKLVIVITIFISVGFITGKPNEEEIRGDEDRKYTIFTKDSFRFLCKNQKVV